MCYKICYTLYFCPPGKMFDFCHCTVAEPLLEAVALLKGCPQSGEVLPILVSFASVLVGLGLRPETISPEPEGV
ncbi:MAG: hypothetical protein NZ602_05540 [Thermoguttaceae bacterium]|nr:hypothetical protein [Thermoguttaceae bacterium]MDW8038845.1 hypothetical protein [Thermoguttaceae bacterium]